MTAIHQCDCTALYITAHYITKSRKLQTNKQIVWKRNPSLSPLNILHFAASLTLNTELQSNYKERCKTVKHCRYYQTNLMSVCPSIVDDMKIVKPTRCYTMVYWTLWFAQHVSGIIMSIIRSLRPYRWPQRVAPHLGYGRLLVWCMAVGLSVRVGGFWANHKVQ
jgi:hypothetical protein